MRAHPDVSGFNLIGLLPFFLVLAAAFLPMVFGRRREPPDAPGQDGDDGGGGGPPPPRGPTRPPRGGIPLDHATPARVRLRDHMRLSDRLPRRDRRPAREPERAPRRVGPRSA